MTTIDWLLADSPTSRLQANAGRAYRMLRALMRNPLAVIGGIIILTLIFAAAFAPWIAPESPLGQNLEARLLPPSAEHWMGTDELGRDIFSRVVYGARITLVIVALVALISAPLGLIIGAVAGYFGGWTDKVLMGLTDVFLSMPKLILALAFVAALGPGIENAIIAIAITAWPAYARIARAETLTFRNSEFIAATRLAGGLPQPDHRAACAAAVYLIDDHSGNAGYGRDHSDRGRAWLPWPWGAAATAGMGGDDFAWSDLHSRSMVGGHNAGLCHHSGQPWLLLLGRRAARCAGPETGGQIMTATKPLLDVENLRVSFPTPTGPVEVVKGLNLSLGRERLGIVGESGSGKSMTGRAILRLIRKPGKMTADRLAFDGTELQGLSERKMRDLRGARISMIMQDPKFSLNPVMTIGYQIAEALKAHENLSRRHVQARVIEMLQAVRINDPEQVAQMYPHQVSGGMGQRIMIAMMLIPRP